MLKIPKKVVERFAGTLKGYQGVVADIKARDVSEADTVTVAQQRIRKETNKLARVPAKREEIGQSVTTGKTRQSDEKWRPAVTT
ncbi:hypothetical protein [Planctellipticum variicoloris]|uniref:hypothetical protein n=1 Tax=Planctellipticum variicoloris TaxID=3064265 RepID=UPI003013A414|nr:hypothetical protein SH412_003080 [Planctomycetaceae bacterium SH412]